jgi:hypothetical protein
VPLIVVCYIVFEQLGREQRYRLVETMSQDKQKYSIADLPQGVSLFFWDGQPASSARRQAQAF